MNVPSYVLGTGLSLLLLCIVASSIYLVWRRPFVGLGVLVAGMAVHNFTLMVLLNLRTPPLLIRVVQSWKELVLVTLTLLAVGTLIRARQRGERWRWVSMDWIALAFSVVLGVYLLLPSSLLHGDSGLLQRLVAFRIAALIPLVYFLGRFFSSPTDRDLSATTWLIVGAGAVVGAFGLYELWLVPTARWLDWGVNLYSSWLGFKYNGPAGLPANFFQSLPDGLLLRRMVSTYISPLGVAYTGLLVWPIAVVLIDRQKQRRMTTGLAVLLGALFLAGLLLAVTRLALLMLVVEVVLLGLALRTRLAWSLAPIVAAAVAAVLFVYPSIGPVVDPYLLPGVSHNHTIIYAGDPSFAEHLRALAADVGVIAQHPFGVGLGGSVHRFVQSSTDAPGTGESAIFGFFGDTGLIGGLLFLAMYGVTLYNGLRALMLAPKRSLASALPLVAGIGGIVLGPIVLTSDVWGDFSVTFLFWWAAGYSASAVLHGLAVPNAETARSRQAA